MTKKLKKTFLHLWKGEGEGRGSRESEFCPIGRKRKLGMYVVSLYVYDLFLVIYVASEF